MLPWSILDEDGEEIQDGHVSRTLLRMLRLWLIDSRLENNDEGDGDDARVC